MEPEEVTSHCSTLPSDPPSSTDFMILGDPAANPMNTEPFIRREISKRLKACENTSPGPDGVTYHLKLIDSNAIAFTPLFNCYLKFKAVPSSWKNTTTIVIFKKGDRKNPGNWRPIALGNTIYKLYASCLNKRLIHWLEINNIFSPYQKGFLPHDGVFENNYVLDNIMRNFKTYKQDLFFASLDISNAFGSLPHWVIFEALRHASAGEEFIDIIKNIYWEAETRFRITQGHSTPRVAATGVRQGDPLSGVIFILAINFVLKKIQREGSARDPSMRRLFHHILAYADDILLIARSAGDLQALLNLINLLVWKIGVRFNPRKCSTLHYSCKLPIGCRPTIFNLAGSQIPYLEDGDPTVF